MPCNKQLTSTVMTWAASPSVIRLTYHRHLLQSRY